MPSTGSQQGGWVWMSHWGCHHTRDGVKPTPWLPTTPCVIRYGHVAYIKPENGWESLWTDVCWPLIVLSCCNFLGLFSFIIVRSMIATTCTSILTPLCCRGQKPVGSARQFNPSSFVKNQFAATATVRDDHIRSLTLTAPPKKSIRSCHAQ